MNIGSNDQQFQSEWHRDCSRLKTEIGETAFDNWLKPVKPFELKGNEVRLSVPSRFMRDWIVANYLDRLKDLWVAENNKVQSIEVFK